MSVLIKGMEMPRNCITCPLCECRNECAYCEVGNKYLSWDWDERLRNNRNDKCPLVEVPSHGRLVDADVVYDKIAEADHAGNYVDMDAVGMAMEEVPTIIEAEG